VEEKSDDPSPRFKVSPDLGKFTKQVTKQDTNQRKIKMKKKKRCPIFIYVLIPPTMSWNLE
jgi:hypothetical protein